MGNINVNEKFHSNSSINLRGVSSEALPIGLKKLTEFLVVKTKEEGSVTGCISSSVFTSYLTKNYVAFGKLLFDHMILLWHKGLLNGTKKPPGESVNLSQEAFMAASSAILGLITDKEQLEFFVKVYSCGKDTVVYKNVHDLVCHAYLISRCKPLETCYDEIFDAVVKSVMHQKESVSIKYLHNWLYSNCPHLVTWMHKYICHVLTVTHRDNFAMKEESEESTPILESASSSSCISLHPPILWLITCIVPSVFTKSARENTTCSSPLKFKYSAIVQKMISFNSPSHWVPLYNSDTQGLSINRFENHVFSYNGPTILFISTEENYLFCLACDEAWHDSNQFWGKRDSILLQVLPEFKAVERGEKMVYFNLTYRGFPPGLQVGNNVECRSLVMDTQLNILKYKGMPLKLLSLEVWGCGTTEIREQQIEIKKREMKDVEKCRKIKLNSLDWVDNPDRYLLEMAGSRPNYARYDKESQGKHSIS